MKKILSENQLLIAKRGISLVAVFAVLVVSLVAISYNWSFGWFSENNDVSANGMSVQANVPTIDVYYRDLSSSITTSNWTKVDLTNPINVARSLTSPGATAKFEIKIVNNSTYPITLKEFGFAAPTASEEVANAAGVFLSTELYTTVESVGAEGASPGFTLNSPPALDETGLALSTGKIDYIQYVSNPSVITLPAGGNVVFKLNIMFVNRETSQNDYKNFGRDNDGVCSRRLYLTYDWQ